MGVAVMKLIIARWVILKGEDYDILCGTFMHQILFDFYSMRRKSHDGYMRDVGGENLFIRFQTMASELLWSFPVKQHHCLQVSSCNT